MQVLMNSITLCDGFFDVMFDKMESRNTQEPSLIDEQNFSITHLVHEYNQIKLELKRQFQSLFSS